MANMKVTYMNKGSGHGNMGDQHTFIRCPKCKEKFVKEKFEVCPHCGGKGKEGSADTKVIFEAAVKKEVAKKLAVVEANAKIAAEVAADNAVEEANAKVKK